MRIDIRLVLDRIRLYNWFAHSTDEIHLRPPKGLDRNYHVKFLCVKLSNMSIRARSRIFFYSAQIFYCSRLSKNVEHKARYIKIKNVIAESIISCNPFIARKIRNASVNTSAHSCARQFLREFNCRRQESKGSFPDSRECQARSASILYAGIRNSRSK